MCVRGRYWFCKTFCIKMTTKQKKMITVVSFARAVAARWFCRFPYRLALCKLFLMVTKPVFCLHQYCNNFNFANLTLNCSNKYSLYKYFWNVTCCKYLFRLARGSCSRGSDRPEASTTWFLLDLLRSKTRATDLFVCNFKFEVVQMKCVCWIDAMLDFNLNLRVGSVTNILKTWKNS